MTLGQNSVMPKFGGGGAGRSKMQQLFLFKPLDRQFKVVRLATYENFKNQLPRSIKPNMAPI